jgi:hypothetical protein
VELLLEGPLLQVRSTLVPATVVVSRLLRLWLELE